MSPKQNNVCVGVVLFNSIFFKSLTGVCVRVCSTTLVVAPYNDNGITRTELQNGRKYIVMIRLTNFMQQQAVIVTNGESHVHALDTHCCCFAHFVHCKSHPML